MPIRNNNYRTRKKNITNCQIFYWRKTKKKKRELKLFLNFLSEYGMMF